MPTGLHIISVVFQPDSSIITSGKQVPDFARGMDGQEVFGIIKLNISICICFHYPNVSSFHYNKIQFLTVWGELRIKVGRAIVPAPFLANFYE